MSTDYAPAIDLQDPRIGWGDWVPSNRRWIIVHGTDGDTTVQAVQQTFISNNTLGRPSSTHFAVGEGGEVAQYVPLSGVAWGNGPITGPSGTAIAGTGNAHDSWWSQFGNANPETVSIEHCKPGGVQNSTPLTAEQTGASFALIAFLCAHLGIPKRVYGTDTPCNANGGVTGHFSMDPVNRQNCPGSYPWQALQAYLDGAPMLDISQVAGYFTQNADGSWQRTGTPYQLRGGILTYYRGFTGTGTLYGFSQFGLPNDNETAVGQPKPGSTAQPVLQTFERVTLAYDPDRVLDSPPGAQGAIYAAHTPVAAPPALSGISIELTAEQAAHVKSS